MVSLSDGLHCTARAAAAISYNTKALCGLLSARDSLGGPFDFCTDAAYTVLCGLFY